MKSRRGEFYLFQIDGDGDPLEAAPVLESGTLPPAVGAVDHVLYRVPVLVVQVVAHLSINNLKPISNHSSRCPDLQMPRTKS